jgi:histidinol-phosphate aminotransferase
VKTGTERLFRPALRALQAYRVQDAAGMVKLDAMENPYGWPAELKRAWLERLEHVELNRYPDGAAPDLKARLRAALAVPDELELLLGNGSDELIQLLCLAVIDAPVRRAGRPVLLAPEPGFAMYRQIAVATGLEYAGVALNTGDFSLDMPAMRAAIERHRPELLFLAYPNNPTGNLFEQADIEALLDIAPGLVVIDEAYQPFAETTAVPLLRDRDNVLLMRTLSKLGLAGIRLGALIGDPQWLGQLDKLRLPYNINSLTQMTGAFACEHIGEFEKQAALIRKQRRQLSERLATLPELTVYPSHASFILFRSERVPAERVFRNLLSQKVLIKNLDGAHPMLENCLRVTVGTPAENECFFSALKHALS